MIYRDLVETLEKNGNHLSIVGGELSYSKNGVPEHCIQLAKEYKTRIIALLNDKNLNQQWKRDNLFLQVMFFYRNVSDPSDDKIERWMNEDQAAAKLFMQLTTEYESCGWQDISEAPFNYENDVTKKLMEELYQNALAFFKKERVTS